jgi:putative transposase
MKKGLRSLRATNPIESVFATMRHRKVRTNGSLSLATGRLIVLRHIIAASRIWRRFEGADQLATLIQAVKFSADIEIIQLPASHAA